MGRESLRLSDYRAYHSAHLAPLTDEEEREVRHGEGEEEEVGRRTHGRILDDDIADCKKII